MNRTRNPTVTMHCDFLHNVTFCICDHIWENRPVSKKNYLVMYTRVVLVAGACMTLVKTKNNEMFTTLRWISFWTAVSSLDVSIGSTKISL